MADRETIAIVHMAEIQCCRCNITFAIPRDFQQRRRDDHAWFYCPSGHRQHYPGLSEAEKLRQEVDRLKQQEAMHEDEKRELRNNLEVATLRVVVEREARLGVEKRVHNGVCPDCGRVFQNMARHMQSKHGAMKCDGLAVNQKINARSATAAANA